MKPAARCLARTFCLVISRSSWMTFIFPCVVSPPSCKVSVSLVLPLSRDLSLCNPSHGCLPANAGETSAEGHLDHQLLILEHFLNPMTTKNKIKSFRTDVRNCIQASTQYKVKVTVGWALGDVLSPCLIIGNKIYVVLRVLYDHTLMSYTFQQHWMAHPTRPMGAT